MSSGSPSPHAARPRAPRSARLSPGRRRPPLRRGQRYPQRVVIRRPSVRCAGRWRVLAWGHITRRVHPRENHGHRRPFHDPDHPPHHRPTGAKLAYAAPLVAASVKLSAVNGPPAEHHLQDCTPGRPGSATFSPRMRRHRARAGVSAASTPACRASCETLPARRPAGATRAPASGCH